MSDHLIYERDGAVARLTLNRPQVGNAFDQPLARALMEAAIDCDEDDTVRCVLITGAGKLFCAGGDVGAFSQQGDALPRFLKEISTYLHAAIARLARMNKPLVTAVNGPAAGAGLSLAILGDIVLAAPAAHFTAAYTGIGLSPDGGLTWLLPRLVGLRRAQEICLRNRKIAAAEAAELGLITRVVAQDTLADQAAGLAQELSRSATSALGATRRLLLDSYSTPIETQMELESRSIAAQGRTGEGREGVAAFIGKRRPDFMENSNG